jgi:hypothetical protein
MSDLEITANTPSPIGNREHIIPRGPHHLPAREDAGEEPAIVLLHGFPTTATCTTGSCPSLPVDEW